VTAPTRIRVGGRWIRIPPRPWMVERPGHRRLKALLREARWSKAAFPRWRWVNPNRRSAPLGLAAAIADLILHHISLTSTGGVGVPLDAPSRVSPQISAVAEVWRASWGRGAPEEWMPGKNIVFSVGNVEVRTASGVAAPPPPTLWAVGLVSSFSGGMDVWPVLMATLNDKVVSMCGCPSFINGEGKVACKHVMALTLTHLPSIIAWLRLHRAPLTASVTPSDVWILGERVFEIVYKEVATSVTYAWRRIRDLEERGYVGVAENTAYYVLKTMLSAEVLVAALPPGGAERLRRVVHLLLQG